MRMAMRFLRLYSRCAVSRTATTLAISALGCSYGTLLLGGSSSYGTSLYICSSLNLKRRSLDQDMLQRGSAESSERSGNS